MASELPPVNNWQPQGPAPYGYGDLQPNPAAKRRKVLLIVGASFIGLMLLLAVAAALMGGDKKQGNTEYITSTAQTSVELIDYDKQVFSMRYPKSLKIDLDEPLAAGNGWFLSLYPGEQVGNQEVSIRVSYVEPEYEDTEEAVGEMLDGAASNSMQTSDIVVAGTNGKKTVAEFTKDDQTFVAVYSTTLVGDKYVEFSALYDKKITEITNSIDVMLGSIKLK